VSCSAANACIAIGSYTKSATTVTLAERYSLTVGGVHPSDQIRRTVETARETRARDTVLIPRASMDPFATKFL
jgi:hypothetical protein